MNPFSELVSRYLADEPYRQLSEDDLWARFRDHRDETAFRVFLDRCGARIYLRCRALLRRDGLAEDAFQETFAELVRHATKLTGYRVAVAWLYQTATHKSLQMMRKYRRARRREEQVALTTAIPATSEAALAAWERQRTLASALVQLPTTQRRVVELVYLEGMTHAEVADTLGIERSAIGTHVRRGLDRLRQHLGRGEGLAVLGAVTIEGALLAHSQPLDRGLAYRLADAAWARALEPLAAVGPWWLSWKALAAGVACAGLVTGGVALGLRHDAPANLAPVVVTGAGPSEPAPVPETLRERNVRIVTNEIVTPLRDIIQEFYPSQCRVEVTDIHAFGSEVEVDFRVTPPPTIPELAARLHATYCVHRRVLRIDGQPNGEVNKWYSMDPNRPLVLPIPVPLGFVIHVAIGREAFVTAEKLFDRLPKDERAEADQIRRLFQTDSTQLVIPSYFNGIGTTAGRLFVVTQGGAMYLQTPDGWRYQGECPGRQAAADDKQFYCLIGDEIWTRPINELGAKWSKWRFTIGEPDKYPRMDLYADDGLFFLVAQHGAQGPVGVWTLSTTVRDGNWPNAFNPICPRPFTASGGRLYAIARADGRSLVTRRIADPPDAWVAIGSLPAECAERPFGLVVTGGQLLAFDWSAGPIYARPLNGGAQAPWKVFGQVQDPPKR